jgi:AraC-like DNA-binding protein
MQTPLSFDPLPRRAPTAEEPLTVNLRRPPPDVVVPLHSHAWAQLAVPLQGGIRVTAAGMSWIVPCFRAVWIPPHIEHEVYMLGRVELRTVYVATEAAPLGLEACTVVEVSDLMRALIEALGRPDDDRERRDLMIRLLLAEMRRAPPLSLGLPLPADRRLQTLCAALMADPASPRDLAAWADLVGASERTMARLFRCELKMSFGAWRQQLRLARALDLIGRGQPLGLVAHTLGYASPAAFTAMFKRAMGVPPSQFMADRGGESPPRSAESGVNALPLD